LLLFFSIADSRPSLKELQRYVVLRVAQKWYSVGLELLDDDKVDELDSIESNDKDCKKCCLKMLRYWTQTHPNGTWNDIINALESPGVELPTVAAELKAMFTSKQCHFRNNIEYLYTCISIEF